MSMESLNCVINAPFLMDILGNPDDSELELLREIYNPSPAGNAVVKFERLLRMSHSLAVLKHPRFTDIPKHRHDYVEMMYVCSGEVIHEIGGNEIHMHAGDILLINQYTYHSVRPCGEHDVAINFAIHQRFFDETYELAAKRTVLSDLIVDILRGRVHNDQYLLFSAVQHLPVHHLLEILLCCTFRHDDDVSPRGDSDRNIVNQHLMFLVIYFLSTDLSAINPQSNWTFEELMLRTVENYIHEYYQSATLRELAKMMNQTESGLSRQIKAVFGVTFKELLQAKRFERAILLLEETNMPVSDIALAVGYENSSYFYRKFRENFNMSPKEYREGQRQN